MSDYEELKRLAGEVNMPAWYETEGGSVVVLNYKAACFVEAASPSTVLALIAENAQLKEDDITWKAGISALGAALKKLTFCARPVTDGPDDALMKACAAAENALSLVSVSRAIDYIDQLKAENESMAELKEYMVQLRETHGFESWAAALVEVDRLKKENEALCSKIANMNASGFGEAFYLVAERLGISGARPVSPMQVFTAEVLPALDKAIKDAERYRFLRRTDSWGDIDFDDQGLWIVNARDEVINQDGVKLDAAVDAAMSKEADHESV